MKYKYNDFVNFIFGQYIEREERLDINKHGIQIIPIKMTIEDLENIIQSSGC